MQSANPSAPRWRRSRDSWAVTDHRAIRQAVEALNHATEEFAARRMDEGIKRALAGRKIGSL